MLVIALLIHTVWVSVPAAVVSVNVLLGVTVIVPDAVLFPPVHPPVMVTV